MDVLGRFKQALKIREVLVDNNVFQLHYRVTALMLLGCAALVASKQHFGDPIDCITRDDVPNKIMDTYCWIHATFTLPNACNKTVGIEVAHPCVDKSSANGNEERVYHKYYQWVYFVLFFQAALFYAPHFFWKSYEGRLLRTITEELRDPLFKLEVEEMRKRARSVAQYLERSMRQHQRYYYLFAAFELANLLNVLAQIYIVDQFLGGTFTTYGLDVIEYAQLEQDDRVDPMVRVFPRMTKCSFHRFGSSGDVQKYDALCILPLNIINEKIYIIMWFWFVFLAALTSVWLVYRALTFFKPKLRLEVLKRRASLASGHELRYILARADTGDWFLLYMICKNMDSQWFNYVTSQVYKRLRRKEQEQRARNGLEGAGFRGAGGTRRNKKLGTSKRGEAEELMLEEAHSDDSEGAADEDSQSFESDPESTNFDQRPGVPPPLDSVKVAPADGGA